MRKILYEDNELKKLLAKIKRYEYRVSQGERHLIMDIEKLKIIRDKVKGNSKKVIFWNNIHYKTRKKINRQIALALKKYSTKAFCNIDSHPLEIAS